MRTLIALSLSLPLLACAGSGGTDATLPATSREADAPVTAGSLLLRDELWPFRVELLRPVVPVDGSGALAPMPGVLVRVEPGGVARVDFGRFGRHEVPVDATDLVERANRVRVGEETKLAPNLVLTIGNKLLDSARDEVHPFPLARDVRLRALLCVFADPASPDFPGVADALRPLAGREGVQSVLFPLGGLRDGRVRQRLRALDWPIPFVFDRFSRLYTRSIAGEEVALPHAMLLTPNGRVLIQGPVSPRLARELDAALGEDARLLVGR